jgi:hypothetical protein
MFFAIGAGNFNLYSYAFIHMHFQGMFCHWPKSFYLKNKEGVRLFYYWCMSTIQMFIVKSQHNSPLQATWGRKYLMIPCYDNVTSHDITERFYLKLTSYRELSCRLQ